MNKKLKLLTLFILINLNCSLKAIEPKKIATTAALATAISASATIGGCFGFFNMIIDLLGSMRPQSDKSDTIKTIFKGLVRINTREAGLYAIGITAAKYKNKEILNIVCAYLIAKNSIYMLTPIGLGISSYIADKIKREN